MSIAFKVTDGKVENESRLLSELKRLRNGVREIVPFKKERSNSQNSYYRACLGYISNYSGEEVEYIHEVMKRKFLMDYSHKVPVPRSTTKLTTDEFTKYVDQIRDWMSGFGVYIPSSEERTASRNSLNERAF